MNILRLKEILAGQPAFRYRQAQEAIYKNLIENWQESSNLGKELTSQLDAACPLKIDAVSKKESGSKTEKILLTLEDGCQVEAVLMRHKDGRRTVCVSSQAGCPLGCAFCATGHSGYKRNLSSSEIVEQVLYFARQLKKKNEAVSNVVFMGMGEPMLNYDNVLEAVHVMNDKAGLNIGSRHISISTIGIVPGIRKLAKTGLQVNLAVSLHAASDRLRESLIPINKKYPLADILKAIEYYLDQTGRKIMLEYVMLKETNDSPRQAEALINLLHTLNRSLYVVNLIAYNDTFAFESSSPEQIKKFRLMLEKENIPVTERIRLGRGINAACGQLAARGKMPERNDRQD